MVEPIREPALAAERLLRSRDREEHLSGRKDRLRISAADEVSSRKDCRPSRVLLIRTRSSA